MGAYTTRRGKVVKKYTLAASVGKSNTITTERGTYAITYRDGSTIEVTQLSLFESSSPNGASPDSGMSEWLLKLRRWQREDAHLKAVKRGLQRKSAKR
jgi:hypothetical protein